MFKFKFASFTDFQPRRVFNSLTILSTPKRSTVYLKRAFYDLNDYQDHVECSNASHTSMTLSLGINPAMRPT